jgi:hypothetical protein
LSTIIAFTCTLRVVLKTMTRDAVAGYPKERHGYAVGTDRFGG